MTRFDNYPANPDHGFSIIEIDDEEQRREAIRMRAAAGARQRLNELAGERPDREVRGGRRMPPLVRHLPPHNQAVPLPAVPKVPRNFQRMRNNTDMIVNRMLAKYGIPETRLQRHNRADELANNCRKETAYRLMRFGKQRGFPLTAKIVGELLHRDRTTVIEAARRYAMEKGFEL